MIKISCDINGEALADIFAERKLNSNELSEECGFDKSYFRTCFHRNYISKPAIKFLERNYGIHYSQYCRQEEAPTIEKAELISPEHAMELSEQMTELNDEIRKVAVQIEKLPHLKCMNADDCVANLTKDELLNAIYKAVYSAVSHAMKERK